MTKQITDELSFWNKAKTIGRILNADKYEILKGTIKQAVVVPIIGVGVLAAIAYGCHYANAGLENLAPEPRAKYEVSQTEQETVVDKAHPFGGRTQYVDGNLDGIVDEVVTSGFHGGRETYREASGMDQRNFEEGMRSVE